MKRIILFFLLCFSCQNNKEDFNLNLIPDNPLYFISIDSYDDLNYNEISFIDDILEAFPNLKGFVGIDFIEYKGELFLIEINSRYTTSMSLIEKCKGKNSLDYIYNRENNLAGKSCRLELI